MMNIQLKMKKTHLIKGKSTKTTKNPTTFRKNKPNSTNVQMNLSYLSTMNYPVFASLTKVKNKPNQTQYKPNSNPICFNALIGLSSFMTSKYEYLCRWQGKKTNPKQTQFKPNWSNAQILSLSKEAQLKL